VSIASLARTCGIPPRTLSWRLQQGWSLERAFTKSTEPIAGHYRRLGRTDHVHIDIARKAIGKALPKKAIVHHVNEIKDDDRPENLVICENQRYHFLLHRRRAAFLATGDPHSRRCAICKQWERPGLLTVRKDDTQAYHQPCVNQRDRERRRRLHG
jgi:hypothetical protein